MNKKCFIICETLAADRSVIREEFDSLDQGYFTLERLAGTAVPVSFYVQPGVSRGSRYEGSVFMCACSITKCTTQLCVRHDAAEVVWSKEHQGTVGWSSPQKEEFRSNDRACRVYEIMLEDFDAGKLNLLALCLPRPGVGECFSTPPGDVVTVAEMRRVVF